MVSWYSFNILGVDNIELTSQPGTLTGAYFFSGLLPTSVVAILVSVLSAVVPSSFLAALSSTVSSLSGEWPLLEIQEPNNLFRDNLDDDSLGDLSILLVFKSGN